VPIDGNLLQGVAPAVAVVLLNYNGHDDTRLCLQSLASATYPRLFVIVCDNASSRPGLDILEAEFPAARFIRNPTNAGFAAGCNIGIAAAIELGAAYVVLLNNDTVVDPGFVEPLLEAFESNPRAGAAGGTILQWDKSPSDRIWYAGGRLSKLRGGISMPGYGQRFVAADHPAVVSTGFVSGCFATIPVRVLNDVGWLDEDFFLGVEDLDFAWRLDERGLASLYVPRAVIWHRSGRSRAFDEDEAYRGYVATMLLQRKHRSRLAYWAWLAAYTIYMRTAGLSRASKQLAGAGYAHGSARAARAAIDRALRDARRGALETRPGPRA
jgi:GT2 family glycosyltransferase